ncbi:MAG: hypothetical protein ASARMPREDX12_008599 [Alectoria sarmentosa]|nr:MAG: hypothetical protein ASARMPREDX12_008599 [Alectoria sarmentosa]
MTLLSAGVLAEMQLFQWLSPAMWRVRKLSRCNSSTIDRYRGWSEDTKARSLAHGPLTTSPLIGTNPASYVQRGTFAMILSPWLIVSALALLPQVSGFASTDSPSDADPAQSGYLPNHNMDPAVVDSAEFGLLWKVPFNFQEQFYAKPLVYTPNAGGNQLVFLASSQNWIRTLDAKTGDPINSRQVHTPFLQSDIPCTDIPNYIGIIGTPIIDTTSDIVYFFSKTYIPNYRYAGDTGAYNGVYYFHGVDINTLADTFTPLLVDGVVADNDPLKYFVGGTVLQRPALTMIGSVVYGGFGGHCDLFNYTGQVVGVDINLQTVVTNFVTEAGPLVPQTNVWNENLGGGQGGIWMSGMALSTDGERLFWVSGNGDGHQNVDASASGSSGCQTLGEACVNLNIGDGGKLLLTDYFQPYDYQNLDGGDQDFGSGGIALLDPTVFYGTGVTKMAVTAGKNGKIYILNANNLGGYRNGPGGTDGVIQTITTNKAVFGGSGSYPLEGGYIYSTPVGYPTYVYKLGFDGNGVPLFTQVGATTEVSAGRVGVGIPTITTYQGKSGTAILWMCDPDAGLRAWYAVPNSDGTMKTINLPQVNGLNKFQRPAFGDTRLYVTDAEGIIYCLGSPVNLPLNCTSPVDFGTVALGSSQTELVNCTAIIAIDQISSVSTGDANFQVSAANLPQGLVPAGTTFSFPVTWNLTTTRNGDTANASYGNVSPGVKSTALTLTTLNGVGGYSTTFPISLTGTEVSQDAFLVLAPVTVDYSGLVLLDYPEDIPTNSLSFTITNAGLSPLTILGYAYTTDDLDDDNIDWTNTTFGGSTQDLGYGFTASDLPVVGTVILGGAQISVDSTFTPVNGTGNYASFFNVWSDGGSQNIILEGSASTSPIANFSISNGEGGWLPQSNLLMDFGDVVPGTSPSLQIRICDVGGSVLEVTKSKPPNGVFRLDDPTDLHESQQIPVDQCAYGTVIFATNAETPNNPDQVYTNSWTLNTDDLTFGVHVVQIQGTVVSRKVGPTNSSGLPIYSYLGCFIDDAPAGRLLPTQPYDNSSNTNGLCQTEAQAGNYIFAGTEYQTECWLGDTPPPSLYQAAETFCTFSCAGDATQVCGGFGGYLSVYYDATRYTPGNNTQPTGAPITVNQTGDYNYIGCYSEATAGRALSGLAPAIPAGIGNTVESCEASCQGYTYFGVEYSNECYCGNTINAGSVDQPSSDVLVNGCSMLCGGNVSEYCGGPNRLDMYQLNGSLPVPTSTTSIPGTSPTPTPGGPSVVPSAGGYGYIGCYTDSTANRALTGLVNPVAGATLTVELCAAACVGFTYFGVEYSAECYCGNALLGGSTLATGGSDPTQNQCDMTCDGNTNEYCGGPNRLNTYQYNASLASVSSSAVPTVTGSAALATSGNASATSAISSTAAPIPTGPITVQSGVGFSYLGCYSDSVTSRALSGLNNPGVASQNDIEQCASECTAFTFFGVEYGAECYCGNTLTGGSALVAGSTPGMTGCSMVCSGNATEYCGGSNRINIYTYVSTVSSAVPSSSAVSSTLSTSFNIANPSSINTSLSSTASSTAIVSSASSVAPTPTAPVHVQAVSNYVYQGCWNDTQQNSNTRTLSGFAYFNTTGMTVELCAAQCSGYTWMGVEYGQECLVTAEQLPTSAAVYNN